MCNLVWGDKMQGGEGVSLERAFLPKSKINVQGESLSTSLFPANLCDAMLGGLVSTVGGL